MGEWQGASCGHAPGNAFYAGNDRGPVYVGRAHHKCDLLPGKVCRGKAYFPYGGEEITKIDYEVLVGSNYSWVGHHPSAPLPGNVVHGGHTSSGETLYVAKVSRDGVDVVGKVHLSHGRAYLPFDGKEHGYENYNILVKN
ncbi:uncharacterized protein LOC135941775 [Cloeon dipterum]|uniref:uncharacterized protein LOC135941775 n=1 Tax=Cloeon dipterum TaxID=197152 RepID=UPI00322090D1